jgi:hypothetical protein
MWCIRVPDGKQLRKNATRPKSWPKTENAMLRGLGRGSPQRQQPVKKLSLFVSQLFVTPQIQGFASGLEFDDHI